MKKIVMMSILVVVCAVIAFGYVSTPVPTFPPTEPNNPNVMAKKTCYVKNEVTFSIDVEDSNDDTLTVTAIGGTVTKRTSVYVGDTTITDANGTYVFNIYKTTYDIKYRPMNKGMIYPEITVMDDSGGKDVKYVELDVRKKNTKPVITGCRVN